MINLPRTIFSRKVIVISIGAAVAVALSPLGCAGGGGGAHVDRTGTGGAGMNGSGGARGPGNGTGGAGCAQDSVVTCDGKMVVQRDGCTMATHALRPCPAQCYLGECVSCLASTGVVCMGNEIHDLDSCGNVGGRLQTCQFGCE